MREQKDRYEIFLKVCETGSFSKAAEALNYTQSGISQMMAGLEEELGVQLFARINRGVTLTDNGTRLLPYIRELANQKTRLRQAAFNINHKVEGKLRVGSISSITTLWMPEVVHYFKENYPKVKIEILDGNYDEIREWIIRGQVDCGFSLVHCGRRPEILPAPGRPAVRCVPGGVSAGCTFQCDPAAAVSVSAHH